MKKINTATTDITQDNIAKLAEIFPDVVTESKNEGGGVFLSVDFDALQEDLSVEACLSSYPKERYQFIWPGKRKAKLEARRPISKALRPCPEKSVNWDTTENIYIEGDNLEALKIMRETYMHKVKMIYIDPPYNTGHDFVYKDNFAKSKEEYLNEDGSYDEEGNRLEENLESNGRFHSDWCSMMYSRLLLARDFLTDDGMIFISIDENELSNLIKISDLIYGESNRLAVITVVNNLKGRSDDEFFATANEYLIVYAWSTDNAIIQGFEPDESYKSEFSYADEISNFKLVGLKKTGKNCYREDRPNMFYSIFYNKEKDLFSLEESCKSDIEIIPYINGREGRWRWGKETFKEKCKTELYFKETNNGPNVYVKMRDIVDGEKRTIRPKTIWLDKKYDTGNGTTQIKNYFGDKIFETPKPIEYVKDIIEISTVDGDVILDFFSGSSTTAQAVMKLNAEDEGNRKFIMVQIPEELDEKSEAFKFGFHNICEIGEERIRRAGNHIKEEINEANKAPKLGEGLKKVPDIGFRVFEVAESNIKDMSLSPDEIHQMNFEELNADNLKEGATNLDLLYEVLPKFRIEYSAGVETEILSDKEVFVVNGNQLVACFDTDITNDVIQAIAEIQPLYAVFRDASFANEAARTNLEEIFKAFSPDTQLRVI